MDSRGQVSVEFLFLILIILIILTSVTIPLISDSIGSSMDVSQVSDSKSALNSIASAVNIVYANGPGARRTVDVYMPQATTLTASSNTMLMTITGLNYKDSGGATQTTKTINATTDYNFNTAQSLSLGKGWNKVQITWVSGGAINLQIV